MIRKATATKCSNERKLKLDVVVRQLFGDAPYNHGFHGSTYDPIFVGCATSDSTYIPHAAQAVLVYQLIEFKGRSSVMGHTTVYV
jgi:hypothetical protein